MIKEKRKGDGTAMTYREITTVLRQAGIDTPEWDAALLIGHFCSVNRTSVTSALDRDYPSSALETAVRVRADRFPLQYLLGEWQFYRQTYEVTPDCLIPRADTEILVERAIRVLPENAFFADLCTGSGCIAVSTLCERPDTTAIAVDLSQKALDIAARNAKRNGVSERLEFACANVLSENAEWAMSRPRPSAILSNPPYVRSGEIDVLSPEVGHEPRMALDGGNDGLVFYRSLLRLAREWLAPNGVCLFEIGCDQADDLRKLAAENGFSCAILRDYGGNDRVAELRRANEEPPA